MSTKRRGLRAGADAEEVVAGRDGALEPAEDDRRFDDEEDEEDEGDYDDYEEEEPAGGDGDAAKPLPPMPEPEDDTMIIVAGLAGFILAMALGIIILRIDQELDKSYVMATGMVGMLSYVLWVSMCSKTNPRAALDDDTISPSTVFFIAAGFGLMLGGLFGDLSRRFPAGTMLIPGLF